MVHKTQDGLDLYYEVQGNLASEECLVFLNGLTQSTLAWALMTPYFKDKYKIVLLDFISECLGS
jgi:hypothetical protein